MTPVAKTCFLCERDFLAEWGRTRTIRLWHASEICHACEAVLRERARGRV